MDVMGDRQREKAHPQTVPASLTFGVYLAKPPHMEGKPVFCLISVKHVYPKTRSRVLEAYHEVQGDGLLWVEAEAHASRKEDPLRPALHGGGPHERAHLVQLINLHITHHMYHLLCVGEHSGTVSP